MSIEDGRTNDENQFGSEAAEYAATEVVPWKRLESETFAQCRVFRVRRDRNQNPRDQSAHDFFVLEAPDWANIIPLTDKQEVVMIEQYRHGIDAVTLEIPGGIVDPGENPREAAARELFEETGYRAVEEVIYLGKTHPNPALQDNWIHTYLAPHVLYSGAPPVHDSTEQTIVKLVPLAEVPGLIAAGRITHSLVVVGFHWLSLYNDNRLTKLRQESV